MGDDQAMEVAQGNRFPFGKNWERFLAVVDDQRITAATSALASMLEPYSLAGRSFLDVGSGSGLSSLAAYRLGARVHAFDYDPSSVACTEELRRRYATEDGRWSVEQGSALDRPFLAGLGQFDVVYSWGVLHHTGAMWQALENMVPLVRRGGRLFVAIYNDLGSQSQRWLRVKRLYNALPKPLALLFAALILGARDAKSLAGDLVKLKPRQYVRRWTEYGGNNSRGMSRWRDHIDWVGGYPFEVAKPEQIILLYQRHGLRLVNLRTWAGGHACNEYVFERPE